MADGYAGYVGYGSPVTPQEAKMKLAAAMAQNSISTAPIRSPWQGAAQLAQALGSRRMMGQIGAGQQAGADSLSSLIGGQAGSVLGQPGTGAVATGGANVPMGGPPPPAPPPMGGAPPSGPPPGPPPSQAGMMPGGMTMPAPGGAPAPPPFPSPPPQAPTGGSLPPPNGAAGLPNTQAAHEAFIRQRAAQLGIDPNFAVSVASAEGLRALSASNPNGASVVDRNPDGTPFSFGDFQLNVRNGLGTEARQHGIDPANPNQWQAADNYALETMAKQGLQPWRGDAAVSAFQKGGGGWTPPPANGMPASASAFSGGGAPAPASAAINGALSPPPPSAGGGFPAPPPSQGGLAPPPPASPQVAQMGDPQAIVARIRQLAQLAQDPNALPETRQMAGQMLQSQMGLIGPHPYTWAAVPGTNDQRQLDWLGNPTGRVIQGGPMKMGEGDQLYSIDPSNPTKPNFAGGSVTPPPNPAAAGNAPPAGGPPPSAAPGVPQPAPSGILAPGRQPQPPSQLAPGDNGLDPMAGVKVPGEDYLASVSSDPIWGRYASQARAILRGQAPYPTGTAATKPQDSKVIQLLLAADPNFNSNVAAARANAVQQFSDRTTPTAPGGMILAANTALNHLGELGDAYGQMNNGEYKAANWIGNELRDWGKGGNPAENSYNFNKAALVEELAKIYKGGTPAQGEIEGMVSRLSPNMTQSEFKEISAKMATLLQGKTNELQREWHTLYGTGAPDYPVLGDQSKAVIQRFAGGGTSTPKEAESGGVHKLDPNNPDADFARLPSKAKFSGPDGKVRIKP